MSDLSSLFNIHNSRSVGFDAYQHGTVPFVSNGFFNNGVVGFVEPRGKDRTFRYWAICISAFCEATVQEPPFLPRGNGGSGLIVLEPRKAMSYEEMLFYAAFINESVRWRFSFGRMVSRDRIERLKLPEYDGKIRPTKAISDLTPTRQRDGPPNEGIHFVTVGLSTLFEVVRGAGKYRGDLPSGRTPLISATGLNNGVLDYVDLTPTFKAPAITVERVGGCAFVQLEDFATVPDDLSVLVPKNRNMPLSLFFLAAATLTAEKWRFSYYRKLTSTRLRRMMIKVPGASGGDIDFEACERLLSGCMGWPEISRQSA